MFKRLTALLAALVAALVSSYAPQKPFSGGFEYRNKTSEEFYIVGLSGFDDFRAVQGPGRMVARGVAALALHPMNFPRESVLSWKDAQGQEQTQVLWSKGRVTAVRNEALVLEYTPQRRWKAFFEKIDYLK